MLTFWNTPDIFKSPYISGAFMEEKEILARTERMYRGADEIIAYMMNDMDLDAEMMTASLACAYANAAWNTHVTLHDGVDLFVTFYKQMIQKGASH
jgi:hypothetical protein